jgi:hypothetical protein
MSHKREAIIRLGDSQGRAWWEVIEIENGKEINTYGDEKLNALLQTCNEKDITVVKIEGLYNQD